MAWVRDWSDFYALSLSTTPAPMIQVAEVRIGALTPPANSAACSTQPIFMASAVPYSTDISVNPLTRVMSTMSLQPEGGSQRRHRALRAWQWRDGVHNIGEIWANTLWQMRANIIADQAGANGDVPRAIARHCNW